MMDRLDEFADLQQHFAQMTAKERAELIEWLDHHDRTEKVPMTYDDRHAVCCMFMGNRDIGC